MSAFEVSAETIHVLVNAAMSGVHERGLSWYTGAERHHVNGMGGGERTPGEVGAMLLAENRASVNDRYDEDEIEQPYEFDRFGHSMRPVEVLKAIGCYEYQSCEHEGWKASEAHAFCRALQSKMIGQLDGYSEAPWDWSADDLRARGIGTRSEIRAAYDRRQGRTS